MGKRTDASAKNSGAPKAPKPVAFGRPAVPGQDDSLRRFLGERPAPQQGVAKEKLQVWVEPDVALELRVFASSQGMKLGDAVTKFWRQYRASLAPEVRRSIEALSQAQA